MSNGQQHLQGITLETLLTQLVDAFGWKTLGELVRINCFRSDPSVKSSLKFLRKTPWARAQVEAVFIGLQEGENTQQIRQRLKAMAGTGSKPSAASSRAKKPAQQKGPRQSGTADPWAQARAKNQQQ